MWNLSSWGFIGDRLCGMAIRVGVIGTAHVHAAGFVSAFVNDVRSAVVGVWDDDGSRAQVFGAERGLYSFDTLDEMLGECEAVVICSENMRHGEQIAAAVGAGKHVLCEKPIAPTRGMIDDVFGVVNGSEDLVLMTAFPCPFSPSFNRMVNQKDTGAIGDVLSICATNQGQCPFGWFVQPSLSGGGAMIDHTVHVTDLLRRLLREDPVAVQAQVGSNMYGEEWDDTAMVTVEFGSGVFATIDSSWTRPKGYKTWGNIKMNVVGTKGVMEGDLFVQGVDVTTESGTRRAGSMSNLDALMVGEYLSAIEEDREPMVTMEDGLWASKVAVAAYESVAADGEVVAI